MAHGTFPRGLNPGMSKSHVTELSEVYAAIFRDAAYAFPTLGDEFSKDFSTLLTLMQQRGPSLVLTDLPAVGKHLDRCLNDGQYQPCGLPLTKRYTRGVVIPKFLRGLYLLVFHENGRLKDAYNMEAVFFLRQILNLVKKAEYSCSQDRIEQELLEFYQTDRSLPEPSRFWGESADNAEDVWSQYHGYDRDPAYTARVSALSQTICSRSGRRPGSVCDQVAGRIVASLGSYDPSDWRFRHGPGAISETSSDACKYTYLQDSWTESLDRHFPMADYSFHSYIGWASWLLSSGQLGIPDSGRVKPEDPEIWARGVSAYGERRNPASRMVAVPKSYRAPRLIAAEPVAHQWCQQNLWHYFRDRVRSSWIGEFVHFGDQTYNQELCIRGSKDDSLATVDLSSASDRVTCDTVGNFFRSNPRLLLAIRASRTTHVRQTISKKLPEFVELRKFSTMGSTCTFPIESLVFLGLALSSVLLARDLKVSEKNIRGLRGEVAVFGDDIIVPKDCRDHFERLFEVFHLKINAAKTFWTGRFRESCGVDSFDGVEVTPVYWKGADRGKAGTLDRTVDTANNFYKKFLHNVASHLSSTLPPQIAEVNVGSGAFGLQTRCKPRNGHLKWRMNLALQRAEYLCVQHIAVSERTQTGGNSALLQYFTEEPSPYIHWESGYNMRPKFRKKLRWVPTSDVEAQRLA